jgi:hypothetical protein
MTIEVLLLIWIVAQGEAIRFYEREVHRIQSEREQERRKWREAKQKTAVKKLEAKSDPSRENPILP